MASGEVDALGVAPEVDILILSSVTDRNSASFNPYRREMFDSKILSITLNKRHLRVLT